METTVPTIPDAVPTNINTSNFNPGKSSDISIETMPSISVLVPNKINTSFFNPAKYSGLWDWIVPGLIFVVAVIILIRFFMNKRYRIQPETRQVAQHGIDNNKKIIIVTGAETQAIP